MSQDASNNDGVDVEGFILRLRERRLRREHQNRREARRFAQSIVPRVVTTLSTDVDNDGSVVVFRIKAVEKWETGVVKRANDDNPNPFIREYLSRLLGPNVDALEYTEDGVEFSCNVDEYSSTQFELLDDEDDDEFDGNSGDEAESESE